MCDRRLELAHGRMERRSKNRGFSNRYGLYHSPDVRTYTLEMSRYVDRERSCVCRDPQHTWRPGPNGFELLGVPKPGALTSVYEVSVREA